MTPGPGTSVPGLFYFMPKRRSYENMRQGGPEEPMLTQILGRPYLHVYRARLKMLELMQLVAYASQTIMGLCRQNHYNRSEFAISKLALMPKLVREITKHMQKFEAEYQATKLPPREEVQPIEKAFGTL